jgi:hypothetical protein
MPRSLFETSTANVTENRCFSYILDRSRIGQKNPVGLPGYTETSADRFPTPLQNPYAYQEGCSVSSAKTDRAGQRAEIGLPRRRFTEICPARAFEAWQAVAHRKAGPLFRRIVVPTILRLQISNTTAS